VKRFKIWQTKFEKILDDDERNDPRFGRQNLKKFWMTMNETAKIWQTKFEKILDDDERNGQDLADKI